MKNNQQDAQRKLFEAWTNDWYDLAKTPMSGSYIDSCTHHAHMGFQAGYNACLEANNIIVLDEGAEPEVGDIIKCELGCGIVSENTHGGWRIDSNKRSFYICRVPTVIQRQGQPVIYNKGN